MANELVDYPTLSGFLQKLKEIEPGGGNSYSAVIEAAKAQGISIPQAQQLAEFFREDPNLADPGVAKAMEDYIGMKSTAATPAPITTEAAAPTTEEQVQAEVGKRQNAALQQKLDEIFGRVGEQGSANIERTFAPAYQKSAADLAARGILRSPISLYQTNEIDRQKAKAMGDLFSGLAGSRASSDVDVAKTLESILAGERRAGEQVKQFGQSLGQQRDIFNQNIGLEEKKLGTEQNLLKRGQDIAFQVGKSKAESEEPGWLDYLNTSLAGLNAAANAKNAFFPKKK